MERPVPLLLGRVISVSTLTRSERCKYFKLFSHYVKSSDTTCQNQHRKLTIPSKYEIPINFFTDGGSIEHVPSKNIIIFIHIEFSILVDGLSDCHVTA